MLMLRPSSRLVLFSSLLLLLLLAISATSIDLAQPSHHGFAEWETTTRRSVAEQTTNSSLVLAEERTRREDPLHDFKRYHGGWNISNQHYWASVGYTAVPFFVIALIWLVVFGMCLALLSLCYCCCRRQRYGYSRLAYALSLILLVLFTVAAIAGCVLLYIGQGKLHGSTSETLNYVVRQADMTVESLKNVSGFLAAAEHIDIGGTVLLTDMRPTIDEIQIKINSSETTLSTKTQDNSRKIKDGLDSMRLALIIVAAVMLFLTFLGFLVSLFGFRCLVYTLVIVGWILVAGTSILCGVFLLLHNVIADTCVAMDDWVKNPTAHTALDDILPCVDNATAQETLLRAQNVTHQLVSVVDRVINTVTNRDFPPSPNVTLPLDKRTGLVYNQSGPLVPVLCNPYNSDLSPRQCQAGEVELHSAPEVWSSYVCEVSTAEICATTGRLTPTIYKQMHAVVNVSFGLSQFGPFLLRLQNCAFVRETFTGIEQNYCPGLRRHSRWIYIGLVLVSAAVMLSLIVWVIYARERRHRAYTKNYDTKVDVPDANKVG